MALSQRETPPTPGVSPAEDRVSRLRERFLHGRREICIARARYLTESHRQSEGQPAVLRRARALEHILRHLTIRIEPDELIVGSITGKPLGAGVYPEGVADRLLGELSGIAERDCNTFTIAPDDQRELVEDILPYWRGKTTEDIARTYWSPAVAANFQKVAPFILTEVGGIGHMLINHERVLERGLLAITEEAQSKQQQTDNEERRAFYEAAATAAQAVIAWANRYADEAELLAGACPPTRRARSARHSRPSSSCTTPLRSSPLTRPFPSDGSTSSSTPGIGPT
jgi:formate C-acetyltransferase